MKYLKRCPNGKIMTYCIHCDRISHTYNNKCTVCGKLKEYDFFFSLPKENREKLLKTLMDYQDSNS